MNQPVIVCGLGRVGWSVLDYLRRAGLAVVVIDQRCAADDPRLAGVRVIPGDCRQKEILQQAGVDRARGVLILTSDDLVNISTTLMIRSLQPDVRVVVRLFNQNLMGRLSQAVKNVVPLSVSGLTAPVLALTALTGTGLGTFRLADGLRQVAEVTAQDLTHLVGQTIADISTRHRLTVIAHLPAGGPERFLLHVEPQASLAPGDRLVVCGRPEDLQPLLAEAGDALLPHLRWAGWLRRNGRMFVRTLREIDWPVQVATAVLLVVIIIGAIVYHIGMGVSLPRALFRTISLMATAADMHEGELPEGWQKVFASTMRLMGVALIAAFTAIFTNYLLRARLGLVLEMRRVPDSGHVVVCGLGNIGYGVVEELLRRGESAVAIERAADNRFVAAIRRQGGAVIVADATLIESLRQANAGTARAVIACTESELANLEIALLARELNPRQRVVVGVADPFLAQVLREGANVRLAMSTSALAAPAFVAALFGDRVLNLFLIAGRPLAVMELTVQADDPTLHRQSVRTLAHDYHMLLAGLVNPDGKSIAHPLEQQLSAGDVITVILTLPDLVQILRRARSVRTAGTEQPQVETAR
jgi:Trk K+ transport system NAD-binding subunit